MKVKLLQSYDHHENTKEYLLGEIVDVEDYPNSDFYHIWIKNNLDILPKKICETYVTEKKAKKKQKTTKKRGTNNV